MSKKKNEEINFEGDLLKLESIVSSLEKGELTLDESIKRFEEGVSLYKGCRDYLNASEKKIKILTEDLKEENYEEDEE